MLRAFNTLENAIKFEVPYTYFHFIVAEEVDGFTFIDNEGNEHKQNRRFLTFRDYNSYNPEQYSYCHEIIIPQTRNSSLIKCIGRAAFDFDIPSSICVPSSFQSHMETIICEIFSKLYNNVDINRFSFVWTVCENIKKTSMHLVIKGCVFEEWVSQLQLLYQQIIHVVKGDQRFCWIDPNMLIDTQLARKNATLRMPLNSKIGGNPLLFMNNKYSFLDGLVCLYNSDDKRNEQYIYLDQCTEMLQKYKIKISIDKPILQPIDKILEQDAIQLFHKYNDPNNAFQFVETVAERFIILKRVKPSKCIINGIKHENENAYLFVCPNKKIYFFCRRGCDMNGKKHKLL
jgi:hypothetical protein